MYILKRLLILLLLIFPFGELLRFDLGNNISLKILDIISGCTTIWIAIVFVKKRERIRTIPWQFVLFPLVGIIALLVNSTWLQSPQFFAAALYLVRWVSYAGFYFAVRSMDKKWKTYLTIGMFIDGIIILLFGFIQYFFYNSLKPYTWLGWDEHMYRIFSVFLDPNFAGAFFVLYFLFIGGLLFQRLEKLKTTLPLIFFKKIRISPKGQIIGLSVLFFITLIAVFLTFSRSSLLMLLVGASVFLILIQRKRIIFILLGIMIGFVLLISPFFHIENINLFREASSMARLNNYSEALKVVHDRPWLGVGFDAYRYAKKTYQIPYGWVKVPSHADAGVDNSILFVLVTTGLIGLIAYLYLWYWLIRTSLVRYRTRNTIFALVFLSSSAGLFVHAMFVNSLFFPEIMIWMWLLFGLTEKK